MGTLQFQGQKQFCKEFSKSALALWVFLVSPPPLEPLRRRTTAVMSPVSTACLGWKLSAPAPLRRRAGSVRAVSRVQVAARADAVIIDGKAIAETVREEVRVKVAAMKEATGGKVPGLAVVLVGARKDSETYVRSKKKACGEAGIESFGTDLPEDATEDEVLAVVAAYNADPAVHGILVQLPMPPHIDEERVLGAIDYEKDVDGFHPLNIGRLSQRGREPLFTPCTPRGCIELLERSGVAIAGKEAVVVGRSNVVGTPAALLLQRRDATVTIVHRYVLGLSKSWHTVCPYAKD